jgi:hypothetical protein
LRNARTCLNGHPTNSGSNGLHRSRQGAVRFVTLAPEFRPFAPDVELAPAGAQFTPHYGRFVDAGFPVAAPAPIIGPDANSA